MNDTAVNKSEIKNTSLVVERNLKLEKLISLISSRFVGINDFNVVLNDSLTDMGKLIDVSRVFLYLFDKEKKYMSNTHEWCNKNIESHMSDFQQLSTKSYPWIMERILNGKAVIINDVSKLPTNAREIKKTLTINGVKSNLSFPLKINNDVIGFIGFDDELISRNWIDEDYYLLQISSQIISNALDRKLKEDKLKKSEERYRTLFESSIDGIALGDLKGNIIDCNQSFVEMVGYSKEEILKMHYEQLTPKKWHKMEYEILFHQLKEKGFCEEYQKEYFHKEGYIVPVSLRVWLIKDKDGNDKGMWAIIKDLSSQKIAEKKSKESNEKYRIILESIKEGYFEVDIKGNFSFFNNALLASIGYSREELMNMHYSQLFDEETKKKIFKVYNNLYKKGEGFELIDYQILRKDGKKVFHESSVYLTCDSNGDITGFKGLTRDVTERKEAEILKKKFHQELEKEVDLRTRELQEALKHQKLYLDQILKSSQFKTEFMATMSHELRTPLNAIIGFTDLLLEGLYGPLNEDQKEFIKDIKSSAEHQFDMIQHILDISKIESGQITLNIQKFSLNIMVEQLISSLKPLYSKKNLKIKIKGLDTEKFIYADPIRFKEILLNLLSNAIKFTIEGKVVLVIEEKYNRWLFQVRDTGIGITEKDFSIIFKEFKRVSSPYVRSMSGTGLGLSLTKRLVELHGGNIDFTSKPGKGSTFFFSIPKNIVKRKKDFSSKDFLTII